MAIHPGLNSRYTVDQKKGEKTMAYLKGYVDIFGRRLCRSPSAWTTISDENL